MTYDPKPVRAEFPALDSGSIFLDNPGGTQVPNSVIQAVVDYYRKDNANLGGAFRTSEASDAMFVEARQAAADLLDGRPEEIVFGQNMTTLSFHLARSIAHQINPGDEIVVTRLDHDANISPWTTMARDRGAKVRWLEFDAEDCTLKLEQLDDLLNPKTKLVAVGYASNAVGTINPVAEICAMAKSQGALTFVDAVQYVPHALTSVKEVGCDFLACSAYKFFGPHVGILWGKHELLEELEAYKVRPSKASAPDKFETGTLNHEGIAGTTAAIDYLAGLAELSGDSPSEPEESERSRRDKLTHSIATMERYEDDLCSHLLDVLEANSSVTVFGITDRDRITERVPTIAITVSGKSPRRVAEELGREDIFVWDGHYYAVDVVESLGVADSGGMVRIGLAHYNTKEEVDRLGEQLEKMAGG